MFQAQPQSEVTLLISQGFRMSTCQIVGCMGWEGLYPLKAQPGSEPRTAAVFWKARKEGREGEREGQREERERSNRKRGKGGQEKGEEGQQGWGGGQWREERAPLSLKVASSGSTANWTSLEMQFRRESLFVG